MQGLESWIANLSLGDLMNFRYKVFTMDQKLCFAGSNGMYQSDDQGRSFHKIATPGMPSELGISAATVTPTEVYCLISGMGIYVRDAATSVWHSTEIPADELQCQPQPCSESCSIALPSDQSLVKFTLSSIDGLSCTVPSTLNSQQLSLDVRTLAAGTYVIQCSFESGLSLHSRFVKVMR